MAAAFHELVRQLLAQKPGRRRAETLRAELTHQLMEVVRTGGLPGVRRVVKQLSKTIPLDPVFATGSVRAWRHAAGGTVLEMQTLTARDLKNAIVSYSKAPRPLGPRERARKEVQDRFYRLYDRVGPAGASPATGRSPAADRLVRAIGDLEADVNNGGFDQYLGNKGRAQARRTGKWLETIGARRTARLLQSALALPPESAGFRRLDTAFGRSAEDLPSLVMRHLEKTAR